MTTPVWRRSAFHATDRTATVKLFCFSEAPLASDVSFSPSTYGAPSDQALDAVLTSTVARDADPAWFDGCRNDALGALAARELADGGASLARARFLHVVAVDTRDPDTLVHLQSAWAVAKWFVAGGASVLLDAGATRWWSGEAVAALAADRAFDLDREILCVLESAPRAGQPGHLLHTRGMAKFARPDVMTFASRVDAATAGAVLRTLAGQMADGRLVAPGAAIEVDGARFAVTAYAPDVNAPDVGLGNDGLVLLRARA